MTATKLPQFIVVRNYLEQLIAAKRMKANAKLPSERILAEDLNTTRRTLREALTQLEAVGTIYRQDRRGWFVTPPRISYDPTNPAFFMDYVASQGSEPKTQVLDVELIKADERLAGIFGIAEKSELCRLFRLRYIDNREVLIERIYLRADKFPGLINQDFSHSLTKVLKQEYGLKISRQSFTIHLVALMNDIAKHLLVVSGTPGLCLKRTLYNEAGELFEYDEEFWRPEALQLKMDVKLESQV